MRVYCASEYIDLNCCDNDVSRNAQYLPFNFYDNKLQRNKFKENDSAPLQPSLHRSLFVVADRWANEEIRTRPSWEVRLSPPPCFLQVLPSKSKFKFPANSLPELDISVNWQDFAAFELEIAIVLRSSPTLSAHRLL